jgi:hypothetical protein
VLEEVEDLAALNDDGVRTQRAGPGAQGLDGAAGGREGDLDPKVAQRVVGPLRGLVEELERAVWRLGRTRAASRNHRGPAAGDDAGGQKREDRPGNGHHEYVSGLLKKEKGSRGTVPLLPRMRSRS